MGAGGDAVPKGEKKLVQWVKIRGKFYDVASFKHPGGNIIDLFLGMDATSSFETFHGHNKKAEIILRALPEMKEKPADVPEQAEGHAEELSKYLVKWREEGLFEPRPVASGLYGLATVAVIVASVVMAKDYPLVAGLAVGAAWAHCGFLQHMGGHREMGAISFPWQHFFEGLLKGGSSSWWRNRHNKHHAKTNVIGEDGDLRTTPFFAWDPTLAQQVPDWSLKTQAFTFLPALGAYVFVFAYTVRKFAVVKKLWLEVFLMMAHYALFFFGLRAAGCGFGPAMTYYCTGYAFQGIYLGFFFGLSHFAVERVPSTATWLESSMCGTVNWAGSSAFAGYVSGFLNVQIEHHMAPQMPMENLRLIRADCKDMAKKFKLPYRELSFVAAVKLMMGGLWKTGRDELKRRGSVIDAASAVLKEVVENMD